MTRPFSRRNKRGFSRRRAIYTPVHSPGREPLAGSVVTWTGGYLYSSAYGIAITKMAKIIFLPTVQDIPLSPRTCSLLLVGIDFDIRSILRKQSCTTKSSSTPSTTALRFSLRTFRTSAWPVKRNRLQNGTLINEPKDHNLRFRFLVVFHFGQP